MTNLLRNFAMSTSALFLTSEEKRKRYYANKELINLHEMVVKIYWFTVPSERKEYGDEWQDMSCDMSRYMKLMSNVVAQQLRDMIEQDSRLPSGTLINDRRVSVPGIWATESIFYVTLPGKPWDSKYETREINIFVSQRCTSNRFGIVPCTLDKKGERIAKMFQRCPPEADPHGECIDRFEMFFGTFDEIMEAIVRLASFESFEALHDYEFKKMEAERLKQKKLPYIPSWETETDAKVATLSGQKGTSSLSRSQRRRLREKKNRSQ